VVSASGGPARHDLRELPDIGEETPSMTRSAIFGLLVVLPLAVHAQDKDAKSLAQQILDKGAELYDTKDATAMAATYTEDARILWLEKDNDTARYKTSVKEGRADIEGIYRDLFKDTTEKTTSRNVVEFARFLAPDLMVIHGTFQPNVANQGKYPFVQVRVKQGDKWLMKSLQLILIAQD
jgi:hypothetical protein